MRLLKQCRLLPVQLPAKWLNLTTMEKSPDSKIEVIVELGLYSESAILKATYKFTDNWYVELKKATEEKVTVIFSPKVPASHSSDIKGEFLNELLDQRLREQIGAETLAVRNLIMAHALSKLDPIQSVHDSTCAQSIS